MRADALSRSAFSHIFANERDALEASLRSADERWLYQAYLAAIDGIGRTHPNPSVGCVLVKQGVKISTGTTEKAGGAHAEVVALRRAKSQARGATAYVTLEPCAHHGRTGPCTLRLIEAGVKRVVIASKDEHQLVNGRGLRALRRAGIEVELRSKTPLGRACQALYQPFFHHVNTGRPYVVAKVAASLDGKVATRTGDSRWVTGKMSRQTVHRLRNACDAVMVGAQTAARDDPALTVRDLGVRKKGRHPIRVVLEGRAKVPSKSALFQTVPPQAGHTIWLGPTKRKRGKAENIVVGEVGKRIVLHEAFEALGKRGITSLLVECGPSLFSSLRTSRLIDELWWFTAPLWVGNDGAAIAEGTGLETMSEAPRLEVFGRQVLGHDSLIYGSIGDPG